MSLLPLSSLSRPKSDRDSSHFDIYHFGPQLLKNGAGVCFRLWAPDAKHIELIVNQGEPLLMEEKANGWRELLVPQAQIGDRYAFRMGGDELRVPDPASRYQPNGVHGPSQVMAESDFQWQDSDWKGRTWEEAVIYELHIGTFTPEGSYRAIIDKLDYLKALGITAIELMPIAQFPGERNWGYDGVALYAPASQYGTPNDLKDLIQAAHQKGLMVFLDVVYNHFGPEGNYLPVYAKSFFNAKQKTPWGSAINFTKQNAVRDFFIENALYWLQEFHFDGLRLDAVHAIKDDSDPHFLNELASVVQERFSGKRHIHLILENELNQASLLRGNESGLFNAQWNDDFHHAAHVALTAEATSYYSDFDENGSGKSAITHLSRCLMTGFAYQDDPSIFRDGEHRGEKSDGLPLTAFVNFVQNHDQIGNRPFGNRLDTMSDPGKMKALLTAMALSPSIPLFFMGEEWQASTPFQFFCDFEPELGHAVTEGRRKEFWHMPEFSDPKSRNTIPDPCAESTFLNSKLNWAELEQKPFQENQQWISHLLNIRQQEIVPRLKSYVESWQNKDNRTNPLLLFQQDQATVVLWPLTQTEWLGLALNLGDSLVSLSNETSRFFKDRLNPIFETEPETLENLKKGILLPASAVSFMTQLS
jgi:malto-oligosyltrehalose trehalohydrolase